MMPSPREDASGDVILQCEGLVRRFGTRTAVDQLSIRVNRGDVYGFLGPNGAGKTTAMRCILGLIRRDAGQVSLFGSSDLVEARRKVGAIIETPAFHVWMSGRDNLRQAAAYSGLSGEDAAREIRRVLERVGLTERAEDRAGTYSLGMKQRLAIARALLGRPQLLLLDEPTNGLDPRGMREMRELIRSLALVDKITIFISSHLLAEVQAVCNRVGIIQDGKMRAEGYVETLLGAGEADAVVELGGSEDRLETVLAAMEGVSLLGPGREGRVRVALTRPIAEVVAELVHQQVAVTAVVPQGRTLEDAFLEVTR